MGTGTPSRPGQPWYFACMHSAWDGGRFKLALQRLMQEAGLERQDIAQLAGINRSQVSRWISGANRPRFDALQSLATAVRLQHPDLDALVAEMIQAAGYDNTSLGLQAAFVPRTDEDDPPPLPPQFAHDPTLRDLWNRYPILWEKWDLPSRHSTLPREVAEDIRDGGLWYTVAALQRYEARMRQVREARVDRRERNGAGAAAS